MVYLTGIVYILWALLNIGLFVYFLFICLQGLKLIREEIGLFAAIIFVLGILSFRSYNDNKNPQPNQHKKWQFATKDSLALNEIKHLNVDLENTVMSSYLLNIHYGKDKNQMKIPISAYSSTSGFIVGTIWKPEVVDVEVTANNTKFKYWVNGVVDWKLFGLKLFSQSKTYKGTELITD